MVITLSPILQSLPPEKKRGNDVPTCESHVSVLDVNR
jgi:hypothetical protein